MTEIRWSRFADPKSPTGKVEVMAPGDPLPVTNLAQHTKEFFDAKLMESLIDMEPWRQIAEEWAAQAHAKWLALPAVERKIQRRIGVAREMAERIRVGRLAILGIMPEREDY